MHNVWRIIDANLNRASEGLRVIEEVARFMMENEGLTADIKRCRHRLAEIRRHSGFQYAALLAARDAAGDVGGAHTYLASEGRRSDYREIAVANIKRVQEAARVLEEFSKLACPELGFHFKQFRFHTYTLEKELAGAWEHRDKAVRTWEWGLYVITGDCWSRGRPLTEVVAQALAGGAKLIQLREKELPVRSLVAAGRRIRELTRAAGVPFIVNDRVDIALAVEADGVHIGQADLPLEAVRRMLGGQKAIGVSVHTLEEAREAEREGADYLGVGPVFATGTKADAQAPVGLALLRELKQAVRIPCVAIGGIKQDNIAEVIRTGADGAAVITAVVGAEDVRAAADRLAKLIRDTKEELKQEHNIETGSGTE
ncbi:MAG TPA: thiamine phosphate synthase [Firmicutes bacterium]|nr:thiamine phosphate synthase [Bacillota bacterium]